MVKMSMLLTLLFASASPAQTVSSQYDHLHSATLQRSKIITEANRQYNRSLPFSIYQKNLRLLFPEYTNSSTRVTPLSSELSLVTERGRGLRGDKVTLMHSNGTSTLALDTTQVPSLNRSRVVQAFASPDFRHIAILLSENQSSLFYKFVIYHQESSSLSTHNEKIYAHLTQAHLSPQWISNTEFLFVEATSPQAREARKVILDVESRSTQIINLDLIAPLPLIAPRVTSIPAEIEPEMNIQVGSAEFTAEDGVKIPARLVLRKNIQWTGNNPVMIKSYGGFNSVTGPSESRVENAMEKDFVRRNGIIVYPQLRGDRGPTDDWYRSAMGAHRKKRTYLDLIAVAQGLVKQNFTSARNIISMGSSNGGLTAAAAALLSPESFGLVISYSAPLDLVAIPNLDPWMWDGWSFDYGNPQNPNDLPLMLQFSPMELSSQQKYLKFIIVAGERDDTVNVAHSIKFYSALRDKGGTPENVHLVVTPYGGHNTGSGREIADLLLTGRIWTSIYNHLGWTH